jgi:hypothetical protein
MMDGKNEQLTADRSIVKGDVREILDAGVNCRYNSYLKMHGEVGMKSDYERMLGDIQEAAKRIAIAKITSLCDEEDLSNNVLLRSQILCQGRQFIIDSDIETDLGVLHIDGLKKVAGFSNLGNFHYIPILFYGGERPGKKQKDLAEALGIFLAHLQGRLPIRAIIYHSQESCLTTVQLSPTLSGICRCSTRPLDWSRGGIHLPDSLSCIRWNRDTMRQGHPVYLKHCSQDGESTALCCMVEADLESDFAANPFLHCLEDLT